MKLLPFELSKRAEVELLFSKVFAESEGEKEGALIGKLVANLITTTAPEDICGFIALENGQIIGSIFFHAITLCHAN